VTDADATPRERGWRRLLPAIALFLFVPAIPQLRALVPIEQTLLLLVPAIAACSWLSWRAGGRLWLAVIWTGLSVVILGRPIVGDQSYAAFARGWSLMLAASFGAVAMFSSARRYFGRALLALVGSAVVVAGVLAVAGVTPGRVDRLISTELADRVETSVSSIRARLDSPEWQDLNKKNPDRANGLIELVNTLEAQLREISPVGSSLFPAFLAFESLAALGLAWSLHHRLSRTRLGPPIAPLREFRFDDHMIWGVVAGLVFVLIPRFAAWKAIGLNLLVFFGALYALRGLGVMMWFLVAPGRWTGVALITAVALLPMLWPLPIVLGLSDTRFDWRRRTRPSHEGSSQ
jgi:hypothetical protein